MLKNFFIINEYKDIEVKRWVSAGGNKPFVVSACVTFLVHVCSCSSCEYCTLQ